MTTAVIEKRIKDAVRARRVFLFSLQEVVNKLNEIFPDDFAVSTVRQVLRKAYEDAARKHKPLNEAHNADIRWLHDVIRKFSVTVTEHVVHLLKSGSISAVAALKIEIFQNLDIQKKWPNIDETNRKLLIDHLATMAQSSRMFAGVGSGPLPVFSLSELNPVQPVNQIPAASVKQPAATPASIPAAVPDNEDEKITIEGEPSEFKDMSEKMLANMPKEVQTIIKQSIKGDTFDAGLFESRMKDIPDARFAKVMTEFMQSFDCGNFVDVLTKDKQAFDAVRTMLDSAPGGSQVAETTGRLLGPILAAAKPAKPLTGAQKREAKRSSATSGSAHNA